MLRSAAVVILSLILILILVFEFLVHDEFIALRLELYVQAINFRMILCGWPPPR